MVIKDFPVETEISLLFQGVFITSLSTIAGKGVVEASENLFFPPSSGVFIDKFGLEASLSSVFANLPRTLG